MVIDRIDAGVLDLYDAFITHISHAPMPALMVGPIDRAAGLSRVETTSETIMDHPSGRPTLVVIANLAYSSRLASKSLGWSFNGCSFGLTFKVHRNDVGNCTYSAQCSCRERACGHLTDLCDVLCTQRWAEVNQLQFGATPLGAWLRENLQEARRENPISYLLGVALEIRQGSRGSPGQLYARPFVQRSDSGRQSVNDFSSSDDTILSPQEREDALCLGQLGCNKYSRVSTELQERTLERAAARRLLVSESDSYGGHTKFHFITIGELVTPAYEWEFFKNGQRLTMPFLRGASRSIVEGRRAWLFDNKQWTLQAIDGDPRTITAALSAPNIRLSEAEALDEDMLAIFDSLALPRPVRVADAIEINAEPVYVLRVSREAHTRDWQGKLTTTHNGVRAPRASDERFGGRVFVPRSGTVYSMPEAFLDTERPEELLSGWGLAVSRTDGASVYTPERKPGLSPRATWLNAAALLETRGVKVVLERGSGLRPDFTVNFGSQRSGLALSEAGEDGLYNIGLKIEIGGAITELAEIAIQALNDHGFTALIHDEVAPGVQWALDLPGGRVVQVPVAEIQRLLAPVMEWMRMTGTAQPRMTALLAATLSDDVDVSRCSRVVAFRKALRELASCRNETVVIPTGFNGTLRPYQVEGCAWLNILERCRLGGMLADEMGLGKTVQILAHLLMMKQMDRLSKPAMVVCPTSVVPNWESEAARFAPALKVCVLHGPHRATKWAARDKFDLLLTSYALLRRDSEQICDTELSLVVLDEAQQVKNFKSQGAAVLRKVKADRILVVTGTPLENNLEELRVLFDYAVPGALGTRKAFNAHFRTPIEKHGDADRRALLTRIIAPLILRRTKDQVAKDLPEKTEIVMHLELLPLQRTLYEQLRLAQYAKVKEAVAANGIGKSKITILAALSMLRQVCCDPRLVKLESASAVEESVKLDALMELLREAVQDGRHVLVFSYFLEMVKLIEKQLSAEGIGYVTLSGETVDRKRVVSQFQSGQVPIFLMTLKAGGLGLNLTAADTVVHYDPWWNPATEDQATGRAHRIGQNKPVLVYRLICIDTLETGIVAMQARKAELARALLDDGAMSNSSFTMKDVECLFNV